jgi:alpha-galactosidase
MEQLGFLWADDQRGRVSDDVWDYWSWPQTLSGQFATAIGWAPHIEPGHWPDADMLPIGHIGPRPGLGSARQTHLTHNEQRTLLTFWCIIRSPLILGSDLPSDDEWTNSLLTNPEVIAVDQHSKNNRPLITTDSTIIWSANADDGKGYYYLAIFNRGERVQMIQLGWNELGLELGKSYSLRDLWKRKDIGHSDSLKLTFQPHACALYRAGP